MAILEKEVWVGLSPSNVNHYKELGYDIPKTKNKKEEMVVRQGERILVKIEDLKERSSVKLTKICDSPNCDFKNGRKVNNQNYHKIVTLRENSEGMDLCFKCSRIKAGKTREKNTNKDKCLWATNPTIAKYLLNKERGYNLTAGSNKKEDFVCSCGYEIKDKSIQSVVNQGLPCPICSDGISYPEKFMLNFLNQLNIEFDYQKNFECKRYDFYIPSLDCIIETHGLQHYKGGFQSYNNGRGLSMEKKNDQLKKEIAINRNTRYYIIINCAKSELKYIKNNILQSNLSKLFNLSRMNWLKCHEFACSSFVKVACDLWNNNYKNAKEISRIMKLSRSTVIRYLKQGSEIKWCDYCPKEESTKAKSKSGKMSGRSVVRLSLSGEYIDEFKSAAEAARYLNFSPANITMVCRGKRKSAGGFKWMYKEDYEKYIEENKVN